MHHDDDDERRASGGGPRYEQDRRRPGFARDGGFDSRSARGGRGGPGPSPAADERSYGASVYGQLPGTGAAPDARPRARQYGGPKPADEAWLQDQGYPQLGRGMHERLTQVEHGPYAAGTQQGGPDLTMPDRRPADRDEPSRRGYGPDRVRAEGDGRGRRERGRPAAGLFAGTRSAGGPHAGRGPRGYRRSDARILDDVHERLTRHPDIDATDVAVDVRDGEVTLRGAVSDRPTRRLAEAIAEGVSGVRDVVNQLRATPTGRSAAGVDDRPDPWSRTQAPGRTALGHTYAGTGMGTGGLDLSDRGAATAAAAASGGRDNAAIGGERSIGGMPHGMATGSDLGTLGTSVGGSAGSFDSGRAGDVAATVQDRETPPRAPALADRDRP